MSTLPSCTDVLVVGAGPVGLLTALGLAQQGIDTVIIGTFFFYLLNPTRQIYGGGKGGKKEKKTVEELKS